MPNGVDQNDHSAEQYEFFFKRLAEPITVGGNDVPGVAWLAVLVPILALGLLYVVWQYRRDARTVGWRWAGPLALARVTVYAVLAWLFLMPANQYWEATEKKPRVLVALDVSRSVTEVSDDLPSESNPDARLPTRWDKVVQFLTDDQVNFLTRLAKKNRVLVYRFGARLDEDAVAFELGEPAEWPAGPPGTAPDLSPLTGKLSAADFALEGLSDAGKAAARKADWFKKVSADSVPAGTVNGLSDADRDRLADNLAKLRQFVRGEQWRRWADFDFSRWAGKNVKDWLLDGLSEPAADAVRRHPPFEANAPASAEWLDRWTRLKKDEMAPASVGAAKLVQGERANDLSKSDTSGVSPFPAADRDRLADNAAKLRKRLDAVRTLQAGTDVRQSVLTLLNRESANLVAGVVVVSDGRSHAGSDSTLRELRSRADTANVPVFGVAVGEDRPVVRIEVGTAQAPERSDPGEAFAVRVEADGQGLAGEQVPAHLELYAPGSQTPSHTLDAVPVRFGTGDPPHGSAEFEVNPAKLPETLLQPADSSAKGRKLVAGAWRLRAAVPRDPREKFAGKVHFGGFATVQVDERPLRVLLLAGGPTREYQFVRTVLARERDAKPPRADLAICLQNKGRMSDPMDVQDVPPKARLRRFPDTLDQSKVWRGSVADKPAEAYMNLAEYDAVVCFDPDWNDPDLTSDQTQRLKRWVENQGGGVIFVGGPVHGDQLARGDDSAKIKPLVEILPVEPGDTVRVGRRKAESPWRLAFQGAIGESPFLKLDDDKPGPTAGWEEFFTGRDKREPGDSTPAERGFYNFTPVQSLKAAASALALFTDPEARTGDNKEVPYIATMPYGKGRTVYLAAGEFWRLRSYREDFYERFWVKLCRYARATAPRRGVLVMGPDYARGADVTVEAQLFTPSGEPMPESSALRATVVPTRLLQAPEAEQRKYRKELPLLPKKTAAGAAGWFTAKTEAEAAGEYQARVDVPGSDEPLTRTFVVREPKPETDVTAPDFAALYQVCGTESQLPGAAPADAKEAFLLSHRSNPALAAAAAKVEEGADGESKRRLFCDLNGAALVPELVHAAPLTERNRGRVDDLWDDGPSLGDDSSGRPSTVGWGLIAAVVLLGFEWLTRKLLRLA